MSKNTNQGVDMKNRTFPIDTGKFKCIEPYSENDVNLVNGKTYEVYSYDCNFVYIWGIKNAKFSYRFFWEHFEET
jgi:hypothetical protein